MTNHSYSKIYYHLIWSTQDRKPYIEQRFRKRLYAYIGRIVLHKGWVLLAIGGIDDHIHILIQTTSRDYIPDIVCKIKSNSSRFVRKYFLSEFCWQEGYSVFTVDMVSLERIKNYILKQEQHHSKISFDEELKETEFNKNY